MKRSSGFTLIELMIVVAIIGILAAIAIPSYQTYVAKSQAARVMSETGGLRSLVESCINEGKLGVGSALGQCDPGAVGSSLINGASQTSVVLPADVGVPQVTIVANGAVTIVSTFSNKAVPFFIAKNLTWARTTDGSWNCSTSIDIVFRPKGCE